MTSLSGAQFNAEYKDVKFIKLTNESECHNGFQFKDGLNVDTVPFNTKDECKPGGIYFCDIKKFFHWLHYGVDDKWMYWFRPITIPDDAKVYVERNKAKADKLIIGERTSIKELWKDKTLCDLALDYSVTLIHYIDDQTDELCKFILRKDGCNISYIKKQTPELCLFAVENCGIALKHIQEQTEELCLAAIKQNCNAYPFINQKFKTPEFYMKIITINPEAVIYARPSIFPIESK